MHNITLPPPKEVTLLGQRSPKHSLHLLCTLTLRSECCRQNLASSLNKVWLYMFKLHDTSSHGPDSQGQSYRVSWQPNETGEWLRAVCSRLCGQRLIENIVLPIYSLKILSADRMRKQFSWGAHFRTCLWHSLYMELGLQFADSIFSSIQLYL